MLAFLFVFNKGKTSYYLSPGGAILHYAADESEVNSRVQNSTALKRVKN